MWAVTITFDMDADRDTMDEIEQGLVAADGAVSRRPRVLYADDQMVTDVTVYVAGDDPARALRHAQKMISAVVGAWTLLATEVVEEKLYLERATASNLPVLVSAPEVGDLLGVSRQRVHQLRETADFPDPLYVLRTGAVWAEDAIRSFARSWDRTPGPRPASHTC